MVLDYNRAKWHSYDAMRPYYMTHVRALVDEGIARWNPAYKENIKDERGVPVEPIALWNPGQAWRAVSFDETRLDDATHGDGGDRSGRSERTLRAGHWDKGDSIGKKNASGQTMSLVGGSNAMGEALIPLISLSCVDFDEKILERGPAAIVNGKRFIMRGTSNPKGSIDGKGILMLVRECLLPMFEAHGVLSPTRRAVVVCDCVGTHMTTEFLDLCTEHNIVVVLRTPWCSNSIQFEDLRNFWTLKNTKDLGWFKVKQQALLLLSQRLSHQRPQGKGGIMLSFELQLQLLVKPWHVAFSSENNRKAWKQVC